MNGATRLRDGNWHWASFGCPCLPRFWSIGGGSYRIWHREYGRQAFEV